MNLQEENNYVYLDEFDSIHSGEIEPLKAEKILFDEIVNKGNCVVLTFNQITDSVAFIEMWKDDEKAEILNYLLLRGKIKINQYLENGVEIRTVSQYIQNSIETIINGKAFIFSAWENYGIGTEDLTLVCNAIRYNDINLLEDNLHENKHKHMLINYFKMITALSDSVNSNTYIKPVVNAKKFSYFMKQIIRCPVLNDEIIKTIKDILYNNEYSCQINSRSFWYKEINKIENKSQQYLLKRIVDSCYSITLESSIDGLYQYSSENFINKVNKDYKLISKNNPDWKIALRLFNDDQLLKKKKRNFKSQLRYHYIKTVFQTICSIFITYIVIKLIDIIFGYCEDNIDSLVNALFQKNNIIIPEFISVILFFFLFGGIILILAEYFGSKISDLLKLPDLLESLQDFMNTIRDIKKLKKYNKQNKD